MERTTMPIHHHKRWIVPALFVLLVAPLVFMHLDTLPLRLWDESRPALSALEMLRNGDPLVVHFDGKPDMWSTKPPLLIWFQALFLSALGPGELALRLPSAIAAFLTGWFLLRTSMKELRDPWLGLTAALILYCSPGYMEYHVARNGDYDSLLVLFMTTSAWAIFRWVRNERSIDLLWFFGLLTLGAMTKGIQAFLFVPGLGLFLLFSRKAGAFLGSRHTYIGLAILITVPATYYVGRESVNPGYLKAVWENEIGGRYTTGLEGNGRPWDFYRYMLVTHHFNDWWVLVPGGIAIGLAETRQAIRSFTLLLTCLGSTYFLVISSAATKLEWYEAPLFPILSALAAIPVLTLFQGLWRAGWAQGISRPNVLPWVLLFCVFAGPYSTMAYRNYKPKEFPWDEDLYRTSYYLHHAVRGGPMQADVICHNGEHVHLRFYVEQLREQGYDIRFLAPEELRVGMRPMVQGEGEKRYLEEHFHHEVLHESGVMRIYELQERKLDTL